MPNVPMPPGPHAPRLGSGYRPCESVTRMRFSIALLSGAVKDAEAMSIDDLPDARDGLTRKERVILWLLQKAEAERKGRGVKAPLLYGRVLEYVDMSVDEFMRIVRRRAGRR